MGRGKRSVVDDVKAIDESLSQVDNIMGSFNLDTVTIEDVINRLRGVNRISVSTKNNIAGSKSYNYFNYATIVTPTVDVEMCGELIQNEMNIELKPVDFLQKTLVTTLTTEPQLQCFGKGFNILKCEFSVSCTPTKSTFHNFI